MQEEPHFTLNKIKKSLFLLFILASFCAGQEKANNTSHIFSQQIRVGKDIIKVHIESEPFISSNHNINSKEWKIDGKGPIGVDGKCIEPLVGIKSIVVTWDGKKFELPQDLHNDVYSPSLTYVERETTGKSEGVLVIPDINNQWIMIRMMSFRWASAPYCVYWIVSKNGKATRFVQTMGT